MITTQMLKGVLEGCILQIINEEETYSYEITKKLEEYGLGEVSEGTIYPLMLRLQRNGLVSSVLKESNSGPKRKYFNLTDKGIQELEQFKQNWTDLSTSVNKLIGGIKNEQKR